MAEDGYGIALDIGTTEIRGALIDMSEGKECARLRELNDQRALGADVMSRLDFATSMPGGMQALKALVLTSVNRLIQRLIDGARIKAGGVRKIIAVGNSAMHHLLLSLNVETLTRAPFLPSKIDSKGITASEIGIHAAPGAIFRFMPNLGGFVGSDTLAVILASGIYDSDETMLVMDIGTNGEIAMGSRKHIIAASCACGPAFEGWHIRCGMPAVDGAIEKVSLDGEVIKFDTIGSGEPRGICGSGLIDIAALMLEKNAMDRSGKLNKSEFIVYENGSVKIFVTQDDIRQLQLAKAAVSAAVDVLKGRLKAQTASLKKVVVTGEFGGRINKENAISLGILPKQISPDRVEILKEGALEGAILMLKDADVNDMVKSIIGKVEHIPLHCQADFNDFFAAAMDF